LARTAVRLSTRTDLLSQHGDACLTLARVLSEGSDVAGCRRAAQDALDLYSRKGNLPGVGWSRNLLPNYFAI
jgi:hypothetical protein